MKHLEYIHVSKAARDSLEYMRARKNGSIRSLTTSLRRFNNNGLGGIEYDTITTIAAPSGGGKSTLAKVLRNDFLTLNPWCKQKYLCFNFEMLASRQISRQATTKFNVTLRELLSATEPVSDELLNEVSDYYENILARQDLYFVEQSGTPKQIVDTIYTFWERQCKNSGHVLVYEIDHTLLITGNQNQSDKDKINELSERLIALKKRISAEGGHSVGLVLSQMNRSSKQNDSIMNPELHIPKTSDLFGSSSLEFCSNLILVQNIPDKLGIDSYTTDHYPTVLRYQTNELDEDLKPVEKRVECVYLHNIKFRGGETNQVYPMHNELYKFNVREMDIDLFNRLHNDFHNGVQEPIVYNNEY